MIMDNSLYGFEKKNESVSVIIWAGHKDFSGSTTLTRKSCFHCNFEELYFSF